MIIQDEMIKCDICSVRYRQEELTDTIGKKICTTCKPKYFQKLRDGSFEKEAIRFYKVAIYHRITILCSVFAFIGGILLVMVSPFAETVYGGWAMGVVIMSLSFWLIMTISTSILAGYLFGKEIGCFYFFSFFIPLMALIVSVLCIRKATKLLKVHGCKVGLTGVSKSTLKELKAKAQNL